MAKGSSPFANLASTILEQSKKVTDNATKDSAAQPVKEELNIIDAKKPLFKDSREITIAGVLPGIAFGKLVAAFGEPVNNGDNTFSFGTGTLVEVDAKNIVKKISLTAKEISTPEGVAVGMHETILNTTYLTADSVDVQSNGADYHYFNKNKTRKFTFVSRDGYIKKIESELLS